VKTKQIILSASVIVALAVASRFGWCIALSSPSKETSARSPDNRFEAKLSRRERVHFWHRGSYDECDIMIESVGGIRLRHIVMEELPIGWVQSSSINWAADSTSVTFAFTNDEAVTKELTFRSIQ